MSISPGLAAELLGFAPDATYWAARQLDGWVVDVGSVITFSPFVEARGAEVTDVRIVITWLQPDAVAPGPGIYRRQDAAGVHVGEAEDVMTAEGEVTVATSVRLGERTISLADPRLRRLALLAAEIELRSD